jgi:glycosyltransferase involved in cell wall biosynthesis
MKILVVSPVGEDAHIRKIPAALARHDGVQVSVVAPERVATEPAYDASGWRTVNREKSENGFRLTTAALKDPAYGGHGFAEPDSIGRVMRESQPDIIQVWGGAPDEHVAQMLRLKARQCPQARLVQYGFNNLPIRWRWRMTLKWRWLWRQMAGALEANSEGLQVMREAGFRQPMERVFWGIAAEDFRAVDALERARLRERLGFGGEKIVGYVGRFVPEKGLRELLAALRVMPREVHGVLIGAGPMQEELAREAATAELAGRVRILGTMAPRELAEYMNCFDALALPSRTTPHWKEQYGRVIGEAMACGVVVVGSDSGAIPEVVGDAGIVVREGDVQALAAALQRALGDASLRARLIDAGHRRVESELSFAAMSGKLMQFYARLLAE